MIEVGNIYKLKKIKNFLNNSDDEFKVCKISGQIATCENIKTGEIYYFDIDFLIDPDYPQDVYSDIIMKEGLNYPSGSIYWKELFEEMGFGSLGAAPCPGLGQSGVASNCTVNGIPVAGQSVKKKKKSKKNEILYTEFLDSPKQVFSFGDSQDREIDYEDALNLLLYGQDELDKKEYTDMLKFFKNCNVLGEFKKFAKEKGIDNIHPDNVGSQLVEDFGDQHIGTPEPEEDIDIKSILAQAEAEENAAISSYLDKANKCKKLGNKELEKLFKELADDETVHVGCLNAASKVLDLENTDKLMDGEEEAVEILTNEVNEDIEDVVESLLNEDFNEAYERITDLVSKYLDRLNFEYANTEDIVYKKEGEYKYLFKFDNELGLIKIKILKGDQTLEEKQWEVNEDEDVEPIFGEIEAIYNRYGL